MSMFSLDIFKDRRRIGSWVPDKIGGRNVVNNETNISLRLNQQTAWGTWENAASIFKQVNLQTTVQGVLTSNTFRELHKKKRKLI